MENRLSTDSTAVTYKTESAKIAVGKPFSIEVVACVDDDDAIAPKRIRVDAGMPTHGHGIAHTPSEKIRSWPIKIRRDGFSLTERLANYPRRLRGRQTPAPNRKGQDRALGFPRSLRRLLWPLLAAACSLISAAAASDTPVYFTDDEKALILSRGPWPVKIGPDPSNRVSGDVAAIAYGKLLFESADLSIDRGRSCLTCHKPTLGHGDGKPRGIGRVRVDRNTMPLFNLRLNTWYGWDGKSDNLWAQSIAPILDPRELGMTPEELQSRIAETPALANPYRNIFGAYVTAHDAETAMVNIAKALAAYQETLTSGRSAFDRFRDALAADDAAEIAAYPAAAQRGAKLFVGRARCDLCHFGTNFTNGEFHDISLPHFPEQGRVDKGRYGGILVLRRSRYNLLGPFNDDAGRTTAGFTRHVRLTLRNWGEFRVPSLRNVARTAPYMHDGSKGTLEDVVRHYSQIPEERLHQDDEKLLRPLNLMDDEIADLVAFLKTL